MIGPNNKFTKMDYLGDNVQEINGGEQYAMALKYDR